MEGDLIFVDCPACGEKIVIRNIIDPDSDSNETDDICVDCGIDMPLCNKCYGA